MLADFRTAIFFADQGKNSYPVFTNIDDCQVEADAVIDFSSPKAFDKLMDYCEKRNMPVVLCMIILTILFFPLLCKFDSVLNKSFLQSLLVLKSANMSLGINTLLKLVQDAAKVLAAAGFDMEIVEKHHNLKVDAPSGTALALADSLNEAMDNQYHTFIHHTDSIFCICNGIIFFLHHQFLL